MRVQDIETPALLVDLDVMERNLRRVADYTQKHGLRLRPHTKTHKSPRIGRRQLDLGAAGLTVAKVGEAEVMLAAMPDSGPADMLVAYPVIGRGKLERLMAVARRARVTVALDSLAAAQQLSEAAHAAGVTIGVLAETDAGMGRVGVSPGTELLDLARGMERLAGLSFEGITFYPGHIKDNGEQSRKALAALGGLIQSILGDFHAIALPLARSAGPQRDPPRHIRLQRLEHLCERRLHRGRVCGHAADDGGFNRAARPDHRRRRLQDVFVGPFGGAGRSHLRTRGGCARCSVP
jgi:D-serine deaminase-like pyridoxal phosphate-dependent protein